MLVDEVQIFIKAGNGGNGSASFIRNSQTARGGPDGGNGGIGGSIFIHAENFNMNGNGRISADGGGYVVQENEVNNLGTINIEISEVVNNLTKLTELVSESDLDEEDKRQLIGDIETVKAQSIKPNPDKTILKRSWQAVEVASSIAGAAQLIGMIGSFVLPHIR